MEAFWWLFGESIVKFMAVSFEREFFAAPPRGGLVLVSIQGKGAI